VKTEIIIATSPERQLTLLFTPTPKASQRVRSNPFLGQEHSIQSDHPSLDTKP
jgi:hypothetical protein